MTRLHSGFPRDVAEEVRRHPIQASVLPDLAPASLDVVDLLPRSVPGCEHGLGVAVSRDGLASAEDRDREVWELDDPRICQSLSVSTHTGFGLDRRSDLDSLRVKVDVAPSERQHFPDADSGSNIRSMMSAISPVLFGPDLFLLAQARTAFRAVSRSDRVSVLV
jgi:hypothetical protein